MLYQLLRNQIVGLVPIHHAADGAEPSHTQVRLPGAHAKDLEGFC